MKKILLTLSVFVMCVCKTYAQFQFGSFYNQESTNMLLQSQMMYLQAKREMDMRVLTLREQVQPLREKMKRSYDNGDYLEAIKIYEEALDYLHYRYDHLAVEDMALLAGLCAENLDNIPLAIELYKHGGQQDMSNFMRPLLRICNSLLSEARTLVDSGQTKEARKVLSLANTTGVNAGQCTILRGKISEKEGDYNTAMFIYKQAKKSKYYGAQEAIKALKAKMKAEKVNKK